jgi:hypothetical protein
MNNPITPEILRSKGLTWYDYEQLVNKLVKENKTTGPDQSERMVEYTKLNLQRMNRTSKTVKLIPELISLLQNLKRSYNWVVLAEAWCGDVAPNLPVINMMTDASPAITFTILLRDENPDIMNAFLTNGSKSIPKLICIDENLDAIGTWGPRPASAQEMVMAYKYSPEPKESYGEFIKKVQLWYAADKGISLQNEFLKLIREWEQHQV